MIPVLIRAVLVLAACVHPVEQLCVDTAHRDISVGSSQWAFCVQVLGQWGTANVPRLVLAISREAGRVTQQHIICLASQGPGFRPSTLNRALPCLQDSAFTV